MSEEVETFYPATPEEWRAWLKKNHVEKQSVWLILYKIKSGVPSISWGDAVDEALCYGWIDSRRRPIDEQKFIQFFSQRKAISNWSKVNKEKIERLITDKRMTPAGLKSIEIAKQNGSWTILDEVEALIVPRDLKAAFKVNSGSESFFQELSNSVKKRILQWIVLAKRPETRQKRIDEIAIHCAQKKIPKSLP